MWTQFSLLVLNEMYEDQKGEFVCKNQGLMIIPTPASGAYDQKSMLAMVTSLRYAFLDGRYYHINNQNLLCSMMRPAQRAVQRICIWHHCWCKGCNWMWMILCNVEKDIKNLWNNGGKLILQLQKEQQQQKKIGVTRALACKLCMINNYYLKTLICCRLKLQKDYKVTLQFLKVIFI